MTNIKAEYGESGRPLVFEFRMSNWGQPLAEDKFEKRIDRLISSLVRLTHNCTESRADPNHAQQLSHRLKHPIYCSRQEMQKAWNLYAYPRFLLNEIAED